MNTVIIQARLTSTRLPKKIIREFNNTSFLDILLSRFVNANLNIPIILASTVNPSDSVLSSYAEKYKIPYDELYLRYTPQSSKLEDTPSAF